MQGGRAPLRGGVRRAVSRVLCPWDLPRCGPPPQGRWPSIYAGGFPPAPAIHPSVDGRAAHGCEHPHSAGSCSGRGLPGRPVTRPPVGSYPTISPSPSPVTAVYFCGTLPEVSLAGCCPAPCSSELGLSSAGRAGRGHLPATQGNIRTRSAERLSPNEPAGGTRLRCSESFASLPASANRPIDRARIQGVSPAAAPGVDMDRASSGCQNAEA